MRNWIKIVESLSLSQRDWQAWLNHLPDAESLLHDATPILSRLPRDKHAIAIKALSDLREWCGGERKIYRVIGIADWNGETEDYKAAHAFAARVINDPTEEVGNFWSRSYNGDPHSNLGGASMGYDVDAEGFPVVLSAICPLEAIHWGATICANIAYPHEEEITVDGIVNMRYVAVDDNYTDFVAARRTGPITHI